VDSDDIVWILLHPQVRALAKGHEQVQRGRVVIVKAKALNAVVEVRVVVFSF
jgi:hypothetical protein